MGIARRLRRRAVKRLKGLVHKMRPMGRSWQADLPRFLGGAETIEIVFDVGGHEGESVVEFRKCFPNARIYSFEPFPETYERLQRNVSSLRNVFTHQLGFAAETGRLPFYAGNESRLNSLLPQGHEYVWQKNSPLEKCAVLPFMTLDDFCAAQGITRIDLLKIDVQGAEDQVLAGSRRMLERGGIRAIRLEVNFLNLYKKQASFAQLFEQLTSAGMAFCGLYDQYFHVNHRLGWCDAVFVLESLFSKPSRK